MLVSLKWAYEVIPSKAKKAIETMPIMMMCLGGIEDALEYKNNTKMIVIIKPTNIPVILASTGIFTPSIKIERLGS